MSPRVLVSILVFAAAACVGTSSRAGAETGQACWLGPPPAIPEPQPIEVDQATVDRANALLDAVAQHTFDVKQLAPQLQGSSLANFFARGAAIVSAYGAPQAMFPFERRVTADATSTYFRVRFPKETLTWMVSADPQGRITRLSLRRTARCLIFNLMYRDDIPY